MKAYPIIIIGGGLTGLTLANLFREHQIPFLLLEARQRLGGRILTTYLDKNAPVEMGATWLGKQHTQVLSLLKELKLEHFEQVLGERAIYEPISTSPPQLVTLPPNSDPSFRIKGGSSKLITTLAACLDSAQIHLGQVVKSIHKTEEAISIQTDKQMFRASRVVSTLPPYLLNNSIEISPALPDSFTQIAQHTHTWMGESIKVALTYAEPFWRDSRSSGTIMSNVGPIPEMYEHANHEDSFFALKGFLNGAYFSVSEDERLAMIMNQLRKYYGPKVENFLSYEEAIWRNEPFTFMPYNSHVLPHQHNGHPVFREPYWGGDFFVAGSETSPQFPGYMEGAIRSAKAVFQHFH